MRKSTFGWDGTVLSAVTLRKLFCGKLNGDWKMTKCRWIKMPPVTEGYEIVRVQEVEDLLEGLVDDKDLLMTDAIVHMGGMILIKEKETEFGRGPEEEK